MHREIYIILILFTCLLAEAGAQSRPDFRAIFWQQVETSCTDGATYHKSITDLTANGSEEEAKAFNIECESGLIRNDNIFISPRRELAYMFDAYYDNPFIREYFNIEEKGNVLIAVLTEEKRDKSDLKYQEFHQAADGSRLTYSESRIERENMLYLIRINIKVWFDDAGRYDHHELEVLSTLKLTGKTYHTLTKGALKDE